MKERGFSPCFSLTMQIASKQTSKDLHLHKSWTRHLGGIASMGGKDHFRQLDQDGVKGTAFIQSHLESSWRLLAERQPAELPTRKASTFVMETGRFHCPYSGAIYLEEPLKKKEPDHCKSICLSLACSVRESEWDWPAPRPFWGSPERGRRTQGLPESLRSAKGLRCPKRLFTLYVSTSVRQQELYGSFSKGVFQSSTLTQLKSQCDLMGTKLLALAKGLLCVVSLDLKHKTRSAAQVLAESPCGTVVWALGGKARETGVKSPFSCEAHGLTLGQSCSLSLTYLVGLVKGTTNHVHYRKGWAQ